MERVKKAIKYLSKVLFYEPVMITTGKTPVEAILSPPTRWEINAVRTPLNVFAGLIVRSLLAHCYKKHTRNGSNGSQPALIDPSDRCRNWSLHLAHFIVALQRLGPNLLGWVPYATAWGIVLSTYHYSTDVLADGAGPPDWVDWIVYGQIAVFSLFAVVQILQQATDKGCERYWHGEVCYIILSLLAKTLLGMILFANLIMYCDGLGRLAERTEDPVDSPPSPPSE